MLRSKGFAKLAVEMDVLLLKAYHRQILPAVAAIPELGDLLTRAVLASSTRVGEIRHLLHDIIAHPTQPGH